MSASKGSSKLQSLPLEIVIQIFSFLPTLESKSNLCTRLSRIDLTTYASLMDMLHLALACKSTMEGAMMTTVKEARLELMPSLHIGEALIKMLKPYRRCARCKQYWIHGGYHSQVKNWKINYGKWLKCPGIISDGPTLHLSIENAARDPEIITEWCGEDGRHITDMKEEYR